MLYDWLMAHGEDVLTGDSFFHLAAFGEALPGLNLCGAGRVVCLIDPIGDVYACPFAIHENFLAGNLLADGGFQEVWQDSALFQELRSPADRRRLRVVPVLRLLPGWVHGGEVLHRPAAGRARPRVRPGVRRGGAGGAPGDAVIPAAEPGPLQGPRPEPATKPVMLTLSAQPSSDAAVSALRTRARSPDFTSTST